MLTLLQPVQKLNIFNIKNHNRRSSITIHILTFLSIKSSNCMRRVYKSKVQKNSYKLDVSLVRSALLKITKHSIKFKLFFESIKIKMTFIVIQFFCFSTFRVEAVRIPTFKRHSRISAFKKQSKARSMGAESGSQ